MTSGVCKIYSHKNLHTDVRAALFIIAQKWKQPKCPRTAEWMGKVRCVHTTRYDWIVRWNEASTRATTEINLENTKRRQP